VILISPFPPQNDLFKKGSLTLVNVFPLISRKFNSFFIVFFLIEIHHDLFQIFFWEPKTSHFLKFWVLAKMWKLDLRSFGGGGRGRGGAHPGSPEKSFLLAPLIHNDQYV